jgi:hypothetical protein
VAPVRPGALFLSMLRTNAWSTGLSTLFDMIREGRHDYRDHIGAKQ